MYLSQRQSAFRYAADMEIAANNLGNIIDVVTIINAPEIRCTFGWLASIMPRCC